MRWVQGEASWATRVATDFVARDPPFTTARLRFPAPERIPCPPIADEDRDVVAMVKFPSLDAFIGLVADPDDQTRAPALREAALERTLWTVP